MADVFISHKRSDRAAAETIASALNTLGLEVWFDASMTAGDAFEEGGDASVAKLRSDG